MFLTEFIILLPISEARNYCTELIARTALLTLSVANFFAHSILIVKVVAEKRRKKIKSLILIVTLSVVFILRIPKRMLSVVKDLVFGTNPMNDCLIVCMGQMKDQFNAAVKEAKSFAIEANTAQRIKIHQPNTLQNRARITGCEGLMKIFSEKSFQHIVNYLWLSEASKCISQIIVAWHGGDNEAVKHNQNIFHAIIDMFIKTDVVTYSRLIDAAISCSIIDTKTTVRSARKICVQRIDFAPSSAALQFQCQKVCDAINEWKKEKQFESSTVIFLHEVYPKYCSYATINLELLQMSYYGNVMCQEFGELHNATKSYFDRFEDQEADEENYEDVDVHLTLDEMVEQLEPEIK